jgi:hypothetical protein
MLEEIDRMHSRSVRIVRVTGGVGDTVIADVNINQMVHDTYLDIFADS